MCPLPARAQALAGVRELLTFLPLSMRDKPPTIACTDPTDRLCPYLDYIVPQSELDVRLGGSL